MADVADIVEDGILAYYTEKIWSMIPAVYRHEDGIAQPPGVLRGLVETWATQAAALHHSQERLWEDFFIELCSDWAVPYIGDLVGTRLIGAQNRRGQRIDVAKTIYYRRRAGTVRVLEELIADMTGWEGVVVEGWQTLARTPHRLDQPPAPRGRLTRNLPGGVADLQRAEVADLIGGPFDEFARTPDVRRRSVHGLSKLGIHLYRTGAVKVNGVAPRFHAAPLGQGFTCDPSGRDVPLFAPRSRPELFDQWRSAREYELRGPISCRLLANAVYIIQPVAIAKLVADVGLTASAAADLSALAARRFVREADLRRQLARLPSAAELLSPGVYPALLRESADPACGKHALVPHAVRIVVDGVVAPVEQIAAANLATWSAAPFQKRVLIDPERGRLLVLPPAAGAVVVDLYAGVYMPLGAGSFTRQVAATPTAVIAGGGALGTVPGAGMVRIEDSRTYTSINSVTGITALTLAAADQQRPYIRLGANWSFTGAPATPPTLDAQLTLEGLWIGANNAARSLVLNGDFEEVTLRYCTLDPGGVDGDGAEIPPVTLVVRGFVESLVVERCILGPVRLDPGGVVGRLTIRDSIVQATRAGVVALAIGTGKVDCARMTVLGPVDVLRLDATDCLFAGVVDVTDTQDGCFRFSAAPVGSRLPRPYAAVTLAPAMAPALFATRAFGQPGYAVLHRHAPASVSRGGEDGAEMGAFSALGAPFKEDGLAVKLAEYMPFGLMTVIEREVA